MKEIKRKEKGHRSLTKNGGVVQQWTRPVGGRSSVSQEARTSRVLRVRARRYKAPQR
jgi:hypothetical protein